jgi:hypothetical protein
MSADSLYLPADAASENVSFQRMLVSTLTVRRDKLRERERGEEIIDAELWQALRDGPNLLLIDGFDELRARYRELWPNRPELLLMQSLADTLDLLPTSHAVIASRKPLLSADAGNFLLQPQFRSYDIYELLPLDPVAGRDYLCRVADPDWQPGSAVPPAAETIIRRLQPELLTSPILIYLLSTLVGGDVGESLRNMGYPPTTNLNLGLIYRLAIDGWLQREFNEYGYYDARYIRRMVPQPGRWASSPLVAAGISREFYERLLQHLAYTRHAGHLAGTPEAPPEFGPLESSIFQLFMQFFSSYRALPEATWWPLRYGDARLPRGFNRLGDHWETDLAALAALAAQVSGGTLLRAVNQTR